MADARPTISGVKHTQAVSEWVEGYLEACRTYEPDAILALFTQDARYSTSPFDPPVLGHEAIVDYWLEDPPEPFTCDWSIVAADNEVAVVDARYQYLDAAGDVDRVYADIWFVSLDPDGRCRDFREHFMLWPGAGNA